MSVVNLRVDIVSDIVCPWCIVGYLRLQQALKQLETEVTADIHWHPFELAPGLAKGGENLRDFLANKYGTSPAGGQQAREQLTDIGNELGFTFNFTPDMLRFNTFKSHQLLAWAKGFDKQTEFKLALFKAYFTDHRNIDDIETLAAIAEETGLDKDKARLILQEKTFAQVVRQSEQEWIDQGVNSIPAQVMEQKYLVPGAQDVDYLVKMLRQLAIEQSE